MDEALAAREDCQVLIAGPSYVKSGIKLKAFDSEARRIGLDLRSCKLTAAQLQGFELERDFDLIFEKQWPKLELVVVDLTLGGGLGNNARENWFNRRVVEWHTFGALPWLARDYAGAPGSRWEKAKNLWVHFEHVLLNYLGVGRGAAVLERIHLLDDPPPDDVRAAPKPERVKRIPGYSKRLARLAIDKSRTRAATVVEPYADELRRKLRGYGYDPIFVIAPVLKTQPLPRSKNPKDPLVVLDFLDPARYPEIYAEEARGHSSHLSREGAKRYSAAMARALYELKERGLVPRARR